MSHRRYQTLLYPQLAAPCLGLKSLFFRWQQLLELPPRDTLAKYAGLSVLPEPTSSACLLLLTSSWRKKSPQKQWKMGLAGPGETAPDSNRAASWAVGAVASLCCLNPTGMLEKEGEAPASHVGAPKMIAAWGTVLEPEVLSRGNLVAAEDKRAWPRRAKLSTGCTSA